MKFNLNLVRFSAKCIAFATHFAGFNPCIISFSVNLEREIKKLVRFFKKLERFGENLERFSAKCTIYTTNLTGFNPVLVSFSINLEREIKKLERFSKNLSRSDQNLLHPVSFL